MKTELLYTNWRDLQAGLIWIYEGAPVLMSGRFTNQESSAWLIRRGHLDIEGAPERVGAGEWVFAPHENHKRVFSEDARIISIKFALRWPDGRLLYKHPDFLKVTAKLYPELERAVMPLLRYIQKSQIEAANLMQYQALDLEHFIRINQLFESWLLAYLKVMSDLGQEAYLSRREDTRVLKAQQWLDAHPLEKVLDLRKLTQSVGLSLGHADTLFSQSFGQTMRGYFDARKYRAAQHRLERTQQPMKEIAYNLGFKDATAFSHWFKKHAQVAPTYYRSRSAGTMR